MMNFTIPYFVEMTHHDPELVDNVFNKQMKKP